MACRPKNNSKSPLLETKDKRLFNYEVGSQFLFYITHQKVNRSHISAIQIKKYYINGQDLTFPLWERTILSQIKRHLLTQFTSNSTKTIKDISSTFSSRHIITSFEHNNVTGFREYHNGRPRGPLWRGKKLIGKEALYDFWVEKV